MVCSAKGVLILSFLLAPLLVAQTAPRRPRGIYAVVNVEDEINQQRGNPTTAQLDAFFNTFYSSLLNNPAISGLALQVHWDTVNPSAPPAANAYLWNYADDAFAQAAAWNAANPSGMPKTIQLIVTPGFQSPQWVLNQLTSCDGLFQTPAVTPPNTCGKVTFTGYQESGDSTELPLPWNPVYKSAWQTFLTALAARYGSNPALVSIAVAGPTASSAEMTMPSNSTAAAQAQFGGIQPNAMWSQLFAFRYAGMAAYQNTDQAFIDEWDNALDLYGQIFSSLTLVGTTGGGLPNFNQNFTLPPAPFSVGCPAPDMRCAAVATILSHFGAATVAGANAKATQTSGLEAARALTLANMGVTGVKNLAQETASLSSPSTQILGGTQFNTGFSNSTVGEGCTAAFPPDSSDTPAGCTIPPSCTTNGCVPVACIPQACLAPGVTAASLSSYKQFSDVPAMDLISPEQAEYNVMNTYFDGTAGASSFGATPGTAPMNYMQVYSQDIQYAAANVHAPASVVQTGGAIAVLSAQDLLNMASKELFMIAEPALLPAIDPGGIVPASSSIPTIQSGEWASIYGSNLAAGTAYWTGNFPTSLNGTSVTIDGQPAYLTFVSPGQIDLQVPNDANTGTVPVVVTTATGSAKATVTLAQFAPSFFLQQDGKHVAGIIPGPNGSYSTIGPTGNSLGYPTVAAKAGQTVELFATGFGLTNPAVPAGQLFSGAAPTTNPVTILINKVSVTPAFAGLSGAGLYQINMTIPSGLGTGDVPLQATVGGATTPAGVVISLQ